MNTTTKHDPIGQGMAQTLCYLQIALDYRMAYDWNLQSGINAFGDTDRPISGIYNDAFPEELKDVMRHQAHKIGYCVSVAQDWWVRSGRRLHTFYPLAKAYRELPDGRISYY
jgi:hypothetical protein